jgi:hypothetical protein
MRLPVRKRVFLIDLVKALPLFTRGLGGFARRPRFKRVYEGSFIYAMFLHPLPFHVKYRLGCEGTKHQLVCLQTRRQCRDHTRCRIGITFAIS